MKRKLQLLPSVLILIFTACKKDNTPTNYGNIEPPAVSTEEISGYFLSQYIVYDPSYPVANPAEVTQQRVFADFLYGEGAPRVDYLLASGRPVPVTMFAPYHELTTIQDPKLNMNDSCVWEVIDTTNGNIRSFKYVDKNPFASMLGKLPDTVSKSKGFRLNIEVGGADSVIAAISGDSTNFSGYISKRFGSANNDYFFTADDIKTLIPSQRTTAPKRFYIHMGRESIVEIKGKRYHFERNYFVYKGVWLAK